MDRGLAKAFGKILRSLREAKGLSQEKLAFECDLDRTYVSMLERGIRQPTLTTVFKLAKTLDVKPSDILVRLESPRKS